MKGVAAFTTPRPWLAISTLAALALFAHWCRDWGVIDSCLDAGYVYDYVREVCDNEALTREIIPYARRHPVFFRTGAVVTLLGLLAAGGTSHFPVSNRPRQP